MSIVLKSIPEEAVDCRAAWAAAPGATHGAHIHHEVACEALTEPIENRIAYILAEKPEHERALRLRLMRPTTAVALAAYQSAVAGALAAYQSAVAGPLAAYQSAKAGAWAAYQSAVAVAHRFVCSVKGCPFDGLTIFPEVTT